jgi:hypothetical protein
MATSILNVITIATLHFTMATMSFPSEYDANIKGNNL